MRALARLALLAAAVAPSACSEPAPEDAASPEPRLDWSQGWGTAGDDFARAVTVFEQGVFVTGYSNGVFEGAANAGSWDAFVARLDEAGNLDWAREWGGEGPEFAQAVVLSGDGDVFVAGYSPSSLDAQGPSGGHDAFLTRYGADGADGWTRQFGTSEDEYVYGAALAPQGVVVVGYTKGGLDDFVNQGEADAFVTLRDFDGEPLWTRQLGTAGTDYAQAVHVDPAGNVLVAGYTAGKLGDDDDLGAEDAFLLALDAQGQELWLRQWGSATTDYALGVSRDAAGNAYVTGYTYGGVAGEAAIGGEDAYLTKVTADGVLSWTRQFGTTGRDSARFVRADASGNVLVGGDTEGAFAKALSGGGRDSFIARFDASSGSETFRAQWGGGPGEFSLAADALGSAIFVAGYIEPESGDRDALLARWSF